MCVGNLRNFSAVKLEIMAYILFVSSWHPFHLCAELTFKYFFLVFSVIKQCLHILLLHPCFCV